MANKKQSETQTVEAEIVTDVPTGTAMARYEQPSRELALTPVFDVAEAKKRMAELQRFVREYLIQDEDYGTIPGTPKPTLYKSGADKLCDIYGLADEYQLTSRTEDWSQNLFDYEVKCTLLSKRTGNLVGTGLGSCSSWESKYRYRDQKRKCPKCGQETIIKGRAEYGGGYLCWKKDGKSNGCGAKFAENDPAIVNQAIGRVENENIPDQKNTILKMAKKRAKIDAVLSVTRSSGLFTQDVEDWQRAEEHEEATTAQPKAAQPPPAAKPAQPKAAATPKAQAPKPAGPPKAETPTQPTTPPVSKETPKPAPATASPKPPAKSRQERARELCNKCGCSTTNLTSFLVKTLGVDPSPEAMKAVPIAKIEAVIWSLEETAKAFEKDVQAVGNFIRDDAHVNPSVRTMFNLAYAKATS